MTTTATPAVPITVEIISSTKLQAFQVTAHNAHEVAAWAEGADWRFTPEGRPVVLLENGQCAYLGDWVMRAILGGFFVATPEYYAQHYRAVA